VAGQVKILLAARLPPALARWLQGHSAEAVREVGLREVEDGVIRAHARHTGAVIRTKDEDFAARSRQEQDGQVIVWWRVGNSSNAARPAWLEPRLPGIGQLVG